MSDKKGITTGFLRGLQFSSGMAEAQYIAAVQQAINDESFKKEGFTTAEEFLTKGLSFKSYETFRKRSSALKSLGQDLTATLLACGYKWNHIRAIESMLPEDAKTMSRNKDIIHIDDQEVNIENKAQVTAMVKLLLEQRNTVRKELKSLQKEFDNDVQKKEGLLSEKKKRIEDLEAIAILPETSEAIKEAWDSIEKHVNEFDIMVRTLIWKKKKMSEELHSDPVLSGKLQGIQSHMQKTLTDLWFNWVNDFGKDEA